MWSVTTAGIVAGFALILTAVVITLRKNDVPKNAFVLLAVGAFLIAGSQFQSFKMSKDGIEVLRIQIQETADAATEVATQAQQAATAAAVTQTQVASLTSSLERTNALSPQAAQLIRRQLAAAPSPDIQRLNAARVNLDRVARRPLSEGAAIRVR